MGRVWQNRTLPRLATCINLLGCITSIMIVNYSFKAILKFVHQIHIVKLDINHKTIFVKQGKESKLCEYYNPISKIVKVVNFHTLVRLLVLLHSA